MPRTRAVAPNRGSYRPATVSGSVAPRPVANTGTRTVASGAPSVGRQPNVIQKKTVPQAPGLSVPRMAQQDAALSGGDLDSAGGSLRISSPLDISRSAQFSRPTMVLDDPPPAPREQRLGTGWIGARVGGGSQPQPRPSAPGPATAEVETGGQVTVTWQDLSTNETGFIIEGQIQIGSSWGPGGTYTVGAGREQVMITVVTGVHRFRVIAVNGSRQSPPGSWSNIVSIDEPSDPDPIPEAPTAPIAEDTGLGSVNFRWTDNSAIETGFEIERNPAFPDPALRTVGANVVVLTDTTGVGTFQYRVRAFNLAGRSAFTGWATVVIADTPPSAPTGLVVTDLGNERDFRLEWSDNSSNEDSFLIERQTQVGSQWGNPASLTAPANSESLVNAAGPGTFRFRIAASNSAGTSPYTAWVTGTVAESTGWTEFTPSSDTRVIYVSSSLGNDSNNGLSEAAPKRTIAAGYALLRNGYPDWMLLRRGDVWVNQTFGTWVKSGRNSQEPMVINTYGDAPARPLIQAGSQFGMRTEYGPNEAYVLHDLAFVGFELHAHTFNGSTEGPVGIQFLMPTNNVLFEDLKIHNFATNFALQGRSNSAGSGIRNLRMRRCVVVDAHYNGGHSQGLFASGIYGGRFEENVFDRNGWKAGVAPPTIFNHNLYITNGCTEIAVVGNIVSDAASHGIQLRCGGEIRENLVYRNAISILLGGGDTGQIEPNGTTGSVIDNIILDGKDIDAQNWRGHGIDLKNIISATVRGNIIANKLSQSGTFAIGSYVSGGPTGVGVRNAEITDNYVINWMGAFQLNALSSPSTYTGNTFARNVVADVRSGNSLIATPTINSSNVTFQNNRFWSTGSPNVFTYSGEQYGLSSWRQRTGDVGSTFTAIQIDSGFGLSQYAVHAGFGSDAAAYITACRARSRFNWNAATESRAVLEYFRARLPD